MQLQSKNKETIKRVNECLLAFRSGLDVSDGAIDDLSLSFLGAMETQAESEAERQALVNGAYVIAAYELDDIQALKYHHIKFRQAKRWL